MALVDLFEGSQAAAISHFEKSLAHRDEAVKRRDQVLAAMARLAMITPEESGAALSDPVVLASGSGGFARAHWDGDGETEALIQTETKATIRCIPLEEEPEPGKCVRSGKDSKQRVYFARAY